MPNNDKYPRPAPGALNIPNPGLVEPAPYSSDVVTYTLSPEEIAARYGPPNPRPGPSPTGRGIGRFPPKKIKEESDQMAESASKVIPQLEDEDWLRQQVNAGLSDEEIGRLLNCSDSTVLRARRKLGIEHAGKNKHDKQQEAVSMNERLHIYIPSPASLDVMQRALEAATILFGNALIKVETAPAGAIVIVATTEG